MGMKLSAHDDFRPANPEFKRIQLLPDLLEVTRSVVAVEEEATAAVECLPQVTVAIPRLEHPPDRLKNRFS
jgi:hypothetical protein